MTAQRHMTEIPLYLSRPITAISASGIPLQCISALCSSSENSFINNLFTANIVNGRFSIETTNQSINQSIIQSILNFFTVGGPVHHAAERNILTRTLLVVQNQKWTWVHFTSPNPTQPWMDPTQVNVCAKLSTVWTSCQTTSHSGYY